MAREEEPPRPPGKHDAYNAAFEAHEEEEDRQIFPAGAAPIMFSASSDHSMRMWDVKAGECQRDFAGHKAAVMCMAVDWEGGRSNLKASERLVLTGSADFTIMKWETKRVIWQSTYEGHEGTVSGLDVDWEERRFASSSYDGTVKIWNVDDEECQQTLEGSHEGPVCCLSVDWETGCVLTGSEDMDIMQWDMEVGCMVMNIEGHTGPVWQVDMDPESMRLMSCGQDRTLKLWDLRSGKMIRSMLKHTLPVGCMEVDWESGRAMTGSSDRSIICWDFETGEDLCVLEGHFGGIWSLSVDWKGNRLVSGAGPCDNGIRIWDFDLDRGVYCAENLQDHNQTVWDLKVDWECCFWEKPESDDEDDEPIGRQGSKGSKTLPAVRVGSKRDEYEKAQEMKGALTEGLMGGF